MGASVRLRAVGPAAADRFDSTQGDNPHLDVKQTYLSVVERQPGITLSGVEAAAALGRASAISYLPFI